MMADCRAAGCCMPANGNGYCHDHEYLAEHERRNNAMISMWNSWFAGHMPPIEPAPTNEDTPPMGIRPVWLDIDAD